MGHDPSDELRRRLTAHFPLFGLQVVTPRLVVQLPTDPDLLELLDVIDAGIHDPAVMPFRLAWTDSPRPQRDRDSLAHWWRNRAEWRPDAWNWTGAVFAGDALVGVQDVGANEFAVLREVRTGSFLGQGRQGQGLGTEMRAAVLHLAFVGLGAVRAYSGYVEGNDRSRRVSEALGYEPNGIGTCLIRGEVRREHHVVLERAAWETRRRDDIHIIGLEPCLPLFGAA